MAGRITLDECHHTLPHSCSGTTINGSLVASCSVSDELEKQNCTASEIRAKLEQKDDELRPVNERERVTNETIIKDLRDTVNVTRLENEEMSLEGKLP